MADPNTASLFPVQAAPIKRPDLVLPHQTVDVVNGDPEDLFYVRIYLLHGANYNDPAAFNHAAVARSGGTCCQQCSLAATGILPER